MVVTVALGLSACDRGLVCGLAPGEKSPSTLPELLKAHDGEVREHGKEICYIKPIGAFGVITACGRQRRGRDVLQQHRTGVRRG